MPEELTRRESRLEAIAEAKAQIEQRAAERFAREHEEYEAKLAERKAKEQRRGKKPGGRPPAPPEPGPKSKDQVNLTDSESRIMRCSGGAFEQTYNAQAAVTTDNMLIVENHITQQDNDKLQLPPAAQRIGMLPESLGTVEPVFGIIKAAMGFRQFLLRGVESVAVE
ncbi:MAG TPA: hypothetical protein ENN79_06600 [Desulfobacteraceae bacterium]|nr:hypothetical protein [Desulfobacteraceae bacterium]